MTEKEAKEERINLRVTKDEKSMLLKAAASAGLTLSAYLLGDKLGQMIMEGFNSANSATRKNSRSDV